MNMWQADIKRNFKEKLESHIAERKNIIAALGCIVHNPKKDGTDRNRFGANFALKGLGERYTTRFGDTYPWVTIDPHFRDGKSEYIDIKVNSMDEEEAAKAGLTGPTKYVDWRFGLTRYAPNTKVLAESAGTLAIVNLIHAEIIPAVEKELAEHEEDLANLDNFMKEAVDLANEFHKLHEKYKDRDLGSFLYTVQKQLDSLYDR